MHSYVCSKSKYHLYHYLLLQGIVMPPRVAPQQVVVIPIPNAKLAPEAKQVHHPVCSSSSSGPWHE